MLERATYVSKGEFQNVMKLPLFIAQCFGLLPVAGILGNDVSDVRFKFGSGKFAYSFTLFVATGIVFFFCCFRLTATPVTYIEICFIVFYGSGLFTISTFLKISRRWSYLVREVSAIEYIYPVTDSKLKSKCNVFCIVIVCAAVLEHILSLLSRYTEINNCHPGDQDAYESYIKSNFPWLDEFNITYSMPIAIILQITLVYTTMIWNYTDVFIICVSQYLTSRFDQVNGKILASRGLYFPECFWRRMREEYTIVSSLVSLVDDVINGVIIIATASDMFFICAQLYNSLANGISYRYDMKLCQEFSSQVNSSPLKGTVHRVYFLYSLTFLICRSLAVTLLAARVHSASLAPLPVLHDVPSPVYCVEVERMLHQVQDGNVALTGLKFFKITRTLILTVVGTIVTYELVLLQFDT